MTTVISSEQSALDLIFERRSAGNFSDEPVTAAQLDTILRAATTVPDHGRLRPWRFAVISGEGRRAFADALAQAALETAPDPAKSEALIAKAHKKAFAAPTLVVIISSPRQSPKVPQWEQVASAACTGYAMVLAGHGLGVGAAWKSYAHAGSAVRELLAMSPTEDLLGWVLLGQSTGPSGVGRSGDIEPAAVTSVLDSAAGVRPY